MEMVIRRLRSASAPRPDDLLFNLTFPFVLQFFCATLQSLEECMEKGQMGLFIIYTKNDSAGVGQSRPIFLLSVQAEDGSIITIR